VRPHVPADGRALRDYLRTVVLGAHLAAREPAAGDRLVEDVARLLPSPVLRYVRTEVVARRRP